MHTSACVCVSTYISRNTQHTVYKHLHQTVTMVTDRKLSGIRRRDGRERFLSRLHTSIMVVAFYNQPLRSLKSSSPFSAWPESWFIVAAQEAPFLPSQRLAEPPHSFPKANALFLLKLTAFSNLLFFQCTNTSSIIAAKTIFNLTSIKQYFLTVPRTLGHFSPFDHRKTNHTRPRDALPSSGCPVQW